MYYYYYPYSYSFYVPYPVNQGMMSQNPTYSPYANTYGQMDRQADSKTDFGPFPYVVNINQATVNNNTYRTALWTGHHLQLTLMSIPVGDSIGLEIHPHTDQFIRIEEGTGHVLMGKQRNQLDIQADVRDDDAVLVPAGTWHNIVNTGTKPLKIYTLYAPPHHPYGTVEMTKPASHSH